MATPVTIDNVVYRDETKVLGPLVMFLGQVQISVPSTNRVLDAKKAEWVKKGKCSLKVREEKEAYHRKIYDALDVNYGEIVAINTNHAHKARVGFERCMKVPKDIGKAPESKSKSKKKPRRRAKRQGDGTSFNSSIEPVIRIPLIVDGQQMFNEYKSKYFVVGHDKFQVPGTKHKDGLDALRVVEAFIDAYRRAVNETLTVTHLVFEMRNYNFHVNDADGISRFLNIHEFAKLLVADFPDDFEIKRDSGPYSLIAALKIKAKKHPVIKFFRSGKFLILGKNTDECVINWYRLISKYIAANPKMIYTKRIPPKRNFFEKVMKATDPAKADPAKADPAKADPAKADPSKTFNFDEFIAELDDNPKQPQSTPQNLPSQTAAL